jgi:hypothetical protein
MIEPPAVAESIKSEEWASPREVFLHLCPGFWEFTPLRQSVF